MNDKTTTTTRPVLFSMDGNGMMLIQGCVPWTAETLALAGQLARLGNGLGQKTQARQTAPARTATSKPAAKIASSTIQDGKPIRTKPTNSAGRSKVSVTRTTEHAQPEAAAA